MTSQSIQITDSLSITPVQPGRVQSAQSVRSAFYALQPSCIAVELPSSLSSSIINAVHQLPEITAVTWKPDAGIDQDRPLMFLISPADPFVEAIRLAIDHEIPLHFIDSTDCRMEEPDSFPDPVTLRNVGAEQYAELVQKYNTVEPDRNRISIIAKRLTILSEQYSSVLYISHIYHTAFIKKALNEGFESSIEDHPPSVIKLLPVQATKIAHLTEEIPNLIWNYEQFRSEAGFYLDFNYEEALHELLHQAAKVYKEEYDETLSGTDWRTLYQFARNLSIMAGQLTPTSYDLVIAAKGCLGDDFASILLELAKSYPPNDEEETLEQLISNDEPAETTGLGTLDFFCDFDGSMERLVPIHPLPERQIIQLKFRRRRPSKLEKMLWKLQAHQSFSGICSWPPEDELIEQFFQRVREKALHKLAEVHSTSEEFTTSLEDGLDIRTTFRNFHEKKIYIKKDYIPRGRVGPVILVWRDLPLAYRNLWQITLYAEHQNESDIAIFSTPPMEEMVGPGISRCEYFGVLSVYPARGIPEVFHLPSLQRWKTNGRLLLAAAAHLSDERYIAYIAPKGPDKEITNYARSLGREIIYLPLGGFGRRQLNRLRQFHILNGKNVRGWASDYIPPL